MYIPDLTDEPQFPVLGKRPGFVVDDQLKVVDMVTNKLKVRVNLLAVESRPLTYIFYPVCLFPLFNHFPDLGLYG